MERWTGGQMQIWHKETIVVLYTCVNVFKPIYNQKCSNKRWDKR